VSDGGDAGGLPFPIPREGVPGAALIFDVDGVLLDVSGSFHGMMKEVVTSWTGRILGEPLPFSSDDIALFKKAGGFNNDFDICCAAIARAILLEMVGTGTVGEQPYLDDWQVYTDKLYTVQGGLGGLAYILMELGLDEEVRAGFDDAYRPIDIVEDAKRIYAGTDRCREVYSIESGIDDGPGLYQAEIPLIPPTWRPPGAFGILTGRSIGELKLAAEMIPFISDSRYSVTEDSGLRKPDPRTLVRVLEEMDVERGYFFGDTADDARTVRNLALERPDLEVLFIHVGKARPDWIIDGEESVPSVVDAFGG